MTPEVLAWDDASNNRLLASGPRLLDPQPDQRLPHHRGTEQGAGRQDLRVALAQGPGGAALVRQLPRLRRHQVLQERGRRQGVPGGPGRQLPRRAKASTGYNMPFLKNYAKPPFPIISEDPKLKPLEQDAEYHFTTGYPGPLTPAADEVYQQFVHGGRARPVRDRQDGSRADDQVGRGEDQGHLRQVHLVPWGPPIGPPYFPMFGAPRETRGAPWSRIHQSRDCTRSDRIEITPGTTSPEKPTHELPLRPLRPPTVLAEQRAPG